MKFRHMLLVSAAALAMPATAFAQQSSTISEGFYVGAQTGVSWLNSFSLAGPVENNVGFDEDWTGLVEAGYRMGNGLRFGLEFSYSDHTVGDITGGVNRVGGDGDLNAYTYMATATYEFDTGSPIRPYLGIGAGVVTLEYDNVGPVFSAGQFVDDKDSAFAYQAHAGLIYSVTPNLDLTLGYRFIDSNGLSYTTTAGTGFEEDYQNHSVLAGVRWVFGSAPPPPPPPVTQPAPQPAAQPAPAPAPAPAPVTRNFTVFFDWDSSELTADAREVLSNVVENARQGSVTAIEVIGHADTSGPADYNQRLSVRRAEAVREYLISQGMPTGQVDIAGRGENDLLVPTPDGVREPSNRRGVIIFP